MKKSKDILLAIDEYRPSLYFDNPKDYSCFIKKLFLELPKPGKQYLYKGMKIVYWNKNIFDLLHNDCVIKDLRN